MLRVFLLLAAAMAVLSVGGFMAGYRWNRTASYPEGIWRLRSAFRSDAIKGRIIVFCPPDTALFREAKQRGYLPFGVCPGGYLPMAKKVIGMGGDMVRVTDGGVIVNGRLVPNSGVLKEDSKKRMMPLVESGVIPAGHLWVMSDYSKRSFDSRYFGPIEQSRVQGVLEPVWVWP